MTTATCTHSFVATHDLDLVCYRCGAVAPLEVLAKNLGNRCPACRAGLQCNDRRTVLSCTGCDWSKEASC